MIHRLTLSYIVALMFSLLAGSAWSLDETCEKSCNDTDGWKSCCEQLIQRCNEWCGNTPAGREKTDCCALRSQEEGDKLARASEYTEAGELYLVAYRSRELARRSPGGGYDDMGEIEQAIELCRTWAAGGYVQLLSDVDEASERYADLAVPFEKLKADAIGKLGAVTLRFAGSKPMQPIRLILHGVETMVVPDEKTWVVPGRYLVKVALGDPPLAENYGYIGVKAGVARIVALAPPLVPVPDRLTSIEARAAFATGMTLYVRSRLAMAADKFVESQEESPSVEAAFNEALCWEHAGRLTAARSLYRSIIDDARAEPWLLERAKGRSVSVDNRLARLILRSVPGGATISIDGDGLTSVTGWTARGNEPGRAYAPEEGVPPRSPGGNEVVLVLLVPGEHEVVVEEDGDERHRSSFSFAEGEVQEIDLAWPPVDPFAVTAVSFGVLAVGGLIGGGIFTGLTFATHSELEDECKGTRCHPGTEDTIDRGETYRTLSEVSFGVMAVSAVVFGITFGLALEGDPDGASVGGIVAPGSVGLAGRF